MIITCDISEPRARAIESIPELTRERESGLIRVLYYLAAEADRLERCGTYPIEADMAADLFADAIEAVKRGELV